RPPPHYPSFPYTTLFRSSTGLGYIVTGTSNSQFTGTNLAYSTTVGPSTVAFGIADNDSSPVSLIRSPNGYLWAATFYDSAVKVSDRKSTRLNSSHVKISY